jgi:hypothetical protein
MRLCATPELGAARGCATVRRRPTRPDPCNTAHRNLLSGATANRLSGGALQTQCQSIVNSDSSWRVRNACNSCRSPQVNRQDLPIALLHCIDNRPFPRGSGPPSAGSGADRRGSSPTARGAVVRIRSGYSAKRVRASRAAIAVTCGSAPKRDPTPKRPQRSDVERFISFGVGSHFGADPHDSGSRARVWGSRGHIHHVATKPWLTHTIW